MFQLQINMKVVYLKVGLLSLSASKIGRFRLIEASESEKDIEHLALVFTVAKNNP